MQKRIDRDEQSLEKLKQIGVIIERIADKILLLICFLIFSWLAYYSLRSTVILYEGSEVPWIIADSIGWNLLTLLIVTILIFLIGKYIKNKGLPTGAGSTPRRLRILTGIITIYVAATCISWISVCHISAKADGAMLCDIAMSMAGGDYSALSPSGYMNYYPHQFSILAVIQILYTMFGVGNNQSFQYMNALCMPLLFFSGYKILRLICSKAEVVIYYILLFVSYIPMFLYVAYVYGDISSTTFAMVFMWQVIRYCKTGEKSCYLWGTVAIVFACMMRLNSIIILVAAGIILVVYAFRAMKPQAIFWFLVMLLAVFTVKDCIKTHYEKISGYEVSDGIPPISWVLMGLEDGPAGPGWYNGTNYFEFLLHNQDTEQTAFDDKNKVILRLKELWANKAYGLDFFRRKTLTQWNSPACHSYFETLFFNCEPEELPKIVHRIYYEDEAIISEFMNRYQFVLYFYVALAMLLSFISKREKHLLENRILMISVIGGFLFHILWEVMGRYALPYVIFLIPVAAMGMGQMQEVINTAIEKCMSAITK